jgi:hypothetical protein
MLTMARAFGVLKIKILEQRKLNILSNENSPNTAYKNYEKGQPLHWFVSSRTNVYDPSPIDS